MSEQNDKDQVERRWTRLYLKPRKTLGQHLLRDPQVLRPLSEYLEVTAQDVVVELGSGSGTLTRFVLQSGPRLLVAIEKDYRFVKTLEERFFEELKDGRFIVMQRDIRELSLRDISKELGVDSLKVVGNIPFYLTGLIFRKLILDADLIELAVLTMQREVAIKISSKPATKTYSFISAGLQTFYHIELKDFISRKKFIPPPKVDSQIVRLRSRYHFRDSGGVSVALSWDREDRDAFLRFLKGVFGSRKRKLLNALRTAGVDLPLESSVLKLENEGKELEVSLSERAYKLSPEILALMFHHLRGLKHKGGEGG